MAEALRHCGRCKNDLPSKEFYPGKNTWCKQCNRNYRMERSKAANPDYKPYRPRFETAAPNFGRKDTARELEMLAFGEEVCRRCSKPWFALYVITSQWVMRGRV